MNKRSFAPNQFNENILPARAKWDHRYANFHPLTRGEPVPLLSNWLSKLPRNGLALDIAAGAGRHSLALAGHGLTVHAIDISFQGLLLLKQQLVPGINIRPITLDLERGWLPRIQYQVIVNFFYLERKLWPAIRANLVPGGWLLMETFTLEQRKLSPKRYLRPEFLLEHGELKEAFASLELLHYAEGVHHGRFTAQLVARQRE